MQELSDDIADGSAGSTSRYHWALSNGVFNSENKITRNKINENHGTLYQNIYKDIIKCIT